MEDLLPIIRAHVVSVWRFRWWAMAASWLITLLGFVAVAFWPDTYEAEAVVYVEASSRLDEVIGGVAIEWNIQEQVDRVRREMLSRPVLETVVRQTDLQLRVNTPQEMSALLGTLQERIAIVDPPRRPGADPRRPTDTALTISYSDRNRDTALAVVDTLLKTFVRDVIRGGQGASDLARTFLVERIADYEKMLTEREAALAQFKRENVGLLPGEQGGSGSDYFTRLQTNMEQLQELEADLRTAINRSEALRAQLSSENPALPPGVLQGATATAATPGNETQTRINELEDGLADLLLRFTDNHPDVIATRQQLDRLYEVRKQELAALAAAGGSEFEGSLLSTSPVYQSIQIALNEAKVEIADLESRIAEQRRRVAELQAKVDIMPEVEARLAGLTRDYDQVKTVHDELISRLEQERLGTAAVRVSDDVNFSVIQPPVADFTPTMPNRSLMLLGLFAVAIAGGGGVAYLMTLLRPVFARARTLQDFAQLPVLGTVSAMHGPGHRRQIGGQLAAFCGLGILLVVTFGALVALRQEAAAFAQSMLV
jgi:polysaccharide chain length determinant protein (PEP-CTERM system associated)